jgi:hypothetical protein
MNRRQVLAGVAVVGGTALSGCLGGGGTTPLKVQNDLDRTISPTAYVARVGDRRSECPEESVAGERAGSVTVEPGMAATITTVTEPGVLRFRLEMDGATPTACVDHAGKENEFVFVVGETVEFVEDDPGVGFT